MRATFALRDPHQGHAAFSALWSRIKPALADGKTIEVSVRPARRSTAQNSRLWAMLNDISRQVEWYGRKLDPEDWKHIFSAALKKSQVVPGIDGGFVVLGQSTSQMSIAEMSELMTLMEAFGAEHGVQFSAQEAGAA